VGEQNGRRVLSFISDGRKDEEQAIGPRRWYTACCENRGGGNTTKNHGILARCGLNGFCWRKNMQRMK